MSTGKTIAVFSDGTGNSSAKLHKTNVWRAYQALDLGDKSAEGLPRQVAYYDDGVGTSTLRPLAMLGGAFGWGLKRNVLDLYKFLCRNYEPGDRIYAFGFSRGAFTIRLLVGFVAQQGLLRGLSKEDLDREAPKAYRLYRRRCFKGMGLARVVRGTWDRIRGPAVVTVPATAVDQIDFVGVWDTVAAYGTPIAELTRGIDRWIWPLWFSDYDLNSKVRAARHALALDDERDTFHPLIWNEASEKTDRIQQVWFAGMHSDVGGGYPDDGLAYVSLAWMMKEAARAGLRFKQDELQRVRSTASAIAPMHDSRRGPGTYYRYQPRRISAYLEPCDPATLLQQDPDDERRAILKSVKVHGSVLQRIHRGSDKYAPIVLPRDYDVVDPVDPIDAETRAQRQQRVDGQQWIWNYVWKRRVNYFLTLAVTTGLLALPLIQMIWKPAPCTSNCYLADGIRAAGSLLPGALDPWIEAYAATPVWFLSIAFVIWALTRRARALQTKIDDRMRALWAPHEPGPVWPAAETRSTKERLIMRLRTAPVYQRSFQVLKWKLLPTVFAVTLLLAPVVLGALATQRSALKVAEAAIAPCEQTAATDGTAALDACSRGKAEPTERR